MENIKSMVYQKGFEANLGQWEEEIQYLLRLNGMNIFFTSKSIILRYNDKEIYLEFEGINSNSKLINKSEIGITTNYFIGSNSDKWASDVPVYETIEYINIYSNIDMVCYLNEGNLEFDFKANVNSNLEDISLLITKADSIQKDNNGNIVVDNIKFMKPYCYQNIQGVKVEIQNNYEVVNNKVKFKVSNYDKSSPLIIDPLLVYSTFLGGDETNFGEGGYAIESDSNGNIYVVGYTNSLNFPVKSPLQPGNNGDFNVIISKFSPKGNLIFSTYLGGSSSDYGSAITLDDENSIYLTGNTSSIDFPVVNPLQSKLKGGVNTFVTKINENGNEIIYSTYLGGSKEDYGKGIAVDNNKNIYVGGYTNSIDYIIQNAYQENLNGIYNAYITKLSADGSSVKFSTYIGGRGNDITAALDIDSHDNVYIVGNTDSFNYPTINAILPTLSGKRDGFITKLNSDGKSILFSTYYGGKEDDFANDLVVGNDDSIIVVGSTESSNLPLVNPIQSVLNGQSNAFITKIKNNEIVFSTYLGGTGFDYANCVAINKDEEIYLIGGTTSVDFPVKKAIQANNKGSTDAFVTKLSRLGDSILFSSYLGGSKLDFANCITNINDNSIGIVGITSSVDFPILNAYQQGLVGSIDIFISKLEMSSNVTFTKTASAKEIYVGEVVEFVLSVKNVGQGEGCSITVRDFLPIDGEFISADASRGDVSLLGKTLTWSFENIESMEEEVLKVVVKATVCGVLDNSAIMYCEDSNEQKASASVKVFEKLSTGPASINRCLKANSKNYLDEEYNSVVLLQNNSNEVSEISILLYDLKESSKKPIFKKDVIIKANCSRKVIIKYIPIYYSLTFDKVSEGVFINTSINHIFMNGCNIEKCETLSSNTFTHTQLISVTNC